MLRALITLYQYAVSPWLGCNCRFHPSCSDYANQAITRFGSMKGAWLTLKRIARCHPFAQHGLDPVPEVIKRPKC